MTENAKFKNGDKVKDTITKYKGTVIGTTLWLNGCYRYVVQSSELGDDGKPIEFSFDENQLELIESKNYKGKHNTGGPWPNPVRR